jgi:hypothetical protein
VSSGIDKIPSHAFPSRNGDVQSGKCIAIRDSRR